jgi:2-isopropylmalate synthase
VTAARHIEIYDTTLRDGCQAEDIAFTVEDKLRITERLTILGSVTPGGWRLQSRDEAFFRSLRSVSRQTQIAAFGSTQRIALERR